ncbi:DNA polymerase III, subunit gamma/tau [Desulfitobacterium dehalogenans ATCC 51507]|uniref:DNA-directed DNA polymerase n=1 Tax=Desulfitobacterium dehalogenans (strain ATCC 51507 / DSM 9161 / JW/IU-DC1) TaxID=756499 RepID=I4A3J7_DESDJ|nr:DNA polymerase III subunit gamma/tau [Desulfitobacterium dehalogenans]AFL98531.1 DNA polymerase III, subunit gamma/tau [Desulfitobacterium dehalogenans ATCC 51507]
MAYLALYREWRPKNFKDMVGQEHVTKTLMNALVQSKVAHAYLLSGPRGTGKTTTAKVLAKALNCEHRDGVEPCNQCPSCLSIDQGSAMEVFEIDAASNRGIDEIRDLRDKVRLSAGESKYKVYIIDEVHMLTTEAFNALLKTLEEPPERVVFILATTEVHKIPLTILSRVQRFEFHRISLEQIYKHLDKVCQTIGRDVDSEALQIIAQKSEGGLRDALSILDQCLLLDGKLGVEQVYQVLGMVGEEFSAKLVDHLLARDYAKTLGFLGEGINQGMDPRQIIRELLDYLRQALLYTSTQAFPHIAPHLKEHLAFQCETIGLKTLLQWIGILLQGESQLKYAANARLAAELLLVQVIYDSGPSYGKESPQVLERLQELEEEIKNLSSGKSRKESKVESPKKAEERSSDLPSHKKHVESPVQDKPVSTQEGKDSSSLSFQDVQGHWGEVLEQVRKRKKSTHAFLMEGKPVELDGDTLVIVFKEGFSFHRDKVNQKENRETIEEVLGSLFGKAYALQSLLENEYVKGNKDSDQAEKSKENPMVKKAADLFGSDLLIVQEE